MKVTKLQNIVDAPKLFISYSWTNDEHINWVITLAEELTRSGVDVKIDKWDLKQGQDAVSFMEQMVANPEITKVLMVVDKKYSDKSDSRHGGVGTEAQIISAEIYLSREQEKFVAAILDKDESGKPILPVYYKSRIFIDFTDMDKYNEKFEELLRWIFDKPLFVRPPLGTMPEFINQKTARTVLTSITYKRVIDAIKNAKPNWRGCLDEYLDDLFLAVESSRLVKPEGELDDIIVLSIKEFIPYRNEYIEIVKALARYQGDTEYIDTLHRFLEKVLSCAGPKENQNSWNRMEFDNLKYISHELFLYTFSILIKNEKFLMAERLLKEQYYFVNSDSGSNHVISTYICFRNYLKSLNERRNTRLKLQRSSVHADLIKENCANSGIDFMSLMQADFILYLHSMINSESTDSTWFPVTLIYASHGYRPFEIFARSESKLYFSRLKKLLGVDDKAGLSSIINEITTGKRLPLTFNGGWHINIGSLMGIDNLEMRP